MLRARSFRFGRMATALGAACALLVSAGPAFGQGSGTATIRGTVQDPSGGVLPGATITIMHTGTKTTQNAVADERGGYTFSGVAPGTYDMKVELSGFKTYEQKAIQISPNDTRGIDVHLDVGQQTETVTVTAQTEVIQTETGAREGVLTAQQIDNLSIIGRSALELIRILPGAVVSANQGESVGTNSGGNCTTCYSVNGVRGTNNTVSLDGSNLIDIGSNNGVIVNPNADMVQEVKVQSSNYAAEYGSGGMQVSAVTKGGGSQFRGTLYDYVRNSRFAANDRSNSISGVEKPKSSFQYPGGNIGGPIVIPGLDFTSKRDKLFFWVGAEVQRQKVDSGSTFGVVPTDAMRQGDFSEYLRGNAFGTNLPTQMTIPRGFPNAGQPMPNNDMRPYIDPWGQKLVEFYPHANYDSGDQQFNYVYQALQPDNRWEFTTRVDWNVTNNTRAFVRFSRNEEDKDQPKGLWWQPSPVELPTASRESSLGRSLSTNVVSVLSPTMTNEFLFSYSKLKLDDDYIDPSRVSKSALGMEDFNGFFGNQTAYAPTSLLDWSGQVSHLWSPGNPVFAYNDTLQFSNKLTKIWGAHALKFGAGVERATKQQNFQNLEEMQMEYGPWTTGGTGSSVADMLLGRPDVVTQGTRIPDGSFRLWNTDLFAQDSWKVRPNLTLEAGLRFSYLTNNAELNEFGAVFDPTTYDPSQGAFLNGDVTRLNGVRYTRYGQAPLGITDNRDPFWMPRVNAAWDIDGQGNNVVRGGFGLFINRPQGNVEYDTTLRVPPTAYQVAARSGTFQNLAGGTGLTYHTIPLVDPYSVLGGQNILSPSPTSIHYPQTYNFSASYARRLFWNSVAEVAYVGTRGRHLVARSDQNFIPPGTLDSGTLGNADLSNPVQRYAVGGNSGAYSSLRPFTAYGNVTYIDYEAVSNYNSMQVTWSRQSSKRFQWFVAYTLSKVVGTTVNEGDTVDPIDPSRTYGTLNYDRRHVLNVSYNLLLPDAIEGGNPILRGLLNGWQLSGISTLSSGVPIRIRFGGDLASDGAEVAWYGTPSFASSANVGGAITPIYLGDPRTGDSGHGDKLFDINALGIPAFGESGPSLVDVPYDLRTPTTSNHDLTLFKNFALPGDRRLQFRAGFFNIFNRAFANTFIDNDINLALNTECNVRVSNVPNGTGGLVNDVCDPTQGFHYTQDAINNFGKINLLRGRRVIEFALKFYF